MKLREFVTIKTSRFDTTLREDHINECCRGEDFAKWLHAKLIETGKYPLAELYQEDFGWVIDSPFEGSTDVVMITIVHFPPDDDCAHELLCVGVDIRSSFMSNLFKKDRKQKLLTIKDELILQVDRIVHGETDFEDISWWHDGPVCGTPAPHPNVA
ncbi:MAG TPA: hypothetical protein VK171_05030 [Fimbriimonas sp.]|nr:hypothetical protein [Fimbriimonas sp.]